VAHGFKLFCGNSEEQVEHASDFSRVQYVLLVVQTIDQSSMVPILVSLSLW